MIGQEKKLSQIQRLCLAFPALEGAPGVEPWDPLALLKWTLVASHGERLAAMFVLGVWNPDTDWDKIAEEHGFLRDGGSVAPFDFFEAVQVLDEANFQALRAWIEEPFFP